MSQINLHALALEIARAEIGVRESGGNNRGPAVDEYQRADTLPGEGYAWCSSFAGAWTLEQVEKRAKVTIPGPRSASCDVMWADARKRGLVRQTPAPGYLFLVRARAKRGYSPRDAIHMGWVWQVMGREFKTIEGNTNQDGGREGHSVLSHIRDVSARYVFFDPFAGLNVPAAKPTAPVVDGWHLHLRDGERETTLGVSAHNGRPMLSTRRFTEFFGLPLEWDARNTRALVDGREVPHQVRLMDGLSFYPARVLGEMFGLGVEADAVKRVVVVTR